MHSFPPCSSLPAHFCVFVYTYSHLLQYLEEALWVSASSFSLQQGPSGWQGTLSILWHSLPLGRGENLLHNQVKWKASCTTRSERHALQCLTEEVDWQKSAGCSIFLRLPPQSLFFFLSFFFFTFSCRWPACGWGNEKERDWVGEIKKSLYELCI